MDLNKKRIPFDGIEIKKRKIKKSFRPYLLESPKNWSKILQNLMLFYKTSSFFIILQKIEENNHPIRLLEHYGANGMKKVNLQNGDWRTQPIQI